MPNTVVLFLLNCGHLMPGTPDLKTHTYCYACKVKTRITGIQVLEWRTYCLNCKFSRWTGASQVLAERQGNRHATFTGHDGVMVEYQENPLPKRLLADYKKHRVLS